MGVGQNKRLTFLFIPLIAFSFLSVSYQMAMENHRAYSSLGFPELTITVMVSITSVFLFLISFSSIMGTLYYSSDTYFYITLPIKEPLVIFSKLTIQYLILLLLNLLFLGPSALYYLIKNATFGWVYIFGGVVLILTPMLPMLLSALLVLFSMKFISRFKSRNVLSVVIGLMLISFILAMQMLISKQANNPEILEKMVLGEKSILDIITRSFPPSLWATKMFMGSMGDGVFYLLFHVGVIFLLWHLSGPLFRKGIRDFGEVSEKGARKKSHLIYKEEKLFFVLVKRQLLIIAKNPTFLLNSIMILFLPFILLLLWSITGVVDIQNLMKGPWKEYIPYTLVLFLASPALTGTFSATGITREGKAFWQIRTMPIDELTDIKARILTTLILCFMGGFPLLIFSFAFVKLTFMTVLWGVVSALSITLLFSIVDLLIDIHRPILNWNNPTHAIKNNMNIILALFLRLLFGFPIYLAKIFWVNWSFSLRILLLSILMLVLSFCAYQYLLKKGIHSYKNLDI